MLADDEKSGHKMNMELSRVYIDLLDDANKALDKSLIEYEQRPDNIGINKLLAEIYLLRGETGKAHEHLTKAQRTGSQDAELK